MNGNNCRDAKQLHPKREQRSLSWSEDANEGFRSVFCKEEIIEVLILNQYWLKHMVISLVQDTMSARSLDLHFQRQFSSIQNTFFTG